MSTACLGPSSRHGNADSSAMFCGEGDCGTQSVQELDCRVNTEPELFRLTPPPANVKYTPASLAVFGEPLNAHKLFMAM